MARSLDHTFAIHPKPLPPTTVWGFLQYFRFFLFCLLQYQLRQDSGIASLKVLEGLKGWDLVEKLHSIGVANPGELARLLEEEDPFEVMEGMSAFGSIETIIWNRFWQAWGY